MAEVKDKKAPAESKGNLKKQSEWVPEKPNLEHGTGTPYIALFTEAGEAIMNPLTGIALGAYVTDFNFNAGDEKEDGLRMQIDTGNPDSADIEEIQESKQICVQWGYVYSDGSSRSSKIHLMKIKQLESVFDDQGTHLTITAKDSVSDLRMSGPYKPNGSIEYTLKNFMDDGLGLDKGIIIELFE